MVSTLSSLVASEAVIMTLNDPWYLTLTVNLSGVHCGYLEKTDCNNEIKATMYEIQLNLATGWVNTSDRASNVELLSLSLLFFFVS